MAGDKTTPSETLTRKPDSDVGQPGSGSRSGDAQTPEQAAITGTGDGGQSDAERRNSWRTPGSEPGRSPAAVGGSSAGHSDQQAADGHGRVAQGHYKVEKERG